MAQRSVVLGGAGLSALLLAASAAVQAAGALVNFNGVIPTNCSIDTVNSGVLAKVNTTLTSLSGGGHSATVTSHCNTKNHTLILDGPFAVLVAAPADQLHYSATAVFSKDHGADKVEQTASLMSGPWTLVVHGNRNSHDISIDMEAEFSPSYVDVPGGNYSYKVTVSLVP
jgi:hypothetical protein